MTKAELNGFRERLDLMVRRLTGERTRLRQQVTGDSDLDGAGASSAQHTTDDLSREKAEEEIALSLLGNEEELLRESRAALARIDQGTFGVCEVCQKPIAKPRLEAIPYARMCITCARAQE